MTTPLPVAARLAWWGTAWVRGFVGPDDLLDAVLDGDVTHVVVSEEPGAGGAGLISALASLRAAGAEAFGAAFPAEGAPIGLGGPVSFNDAALEEGEAVVAIGADVGLVPHRVGPTVEWTTHPARRRQIPDVGEADRELRQVLLGTADTLAALDVARWRPEVADRLMNLRHRPTITPPPGVPPRCVELLGRALQALDIVDVAREDDGGAVTALEMQRRHDALTPLAASARRALVAACSPEVWPPV